MKNLSKKVALSVLALGVTLAMTALCYAYPKPSIVPAAGEWTVDVEYSRPFQVSLRLPGDRRSVRPQRFWCMILTVTNNTGKDVPFYPACDLVTDTFKVIPAGKDTMQVVFKKIKNLQQGRYPFLEPLEYVGNKLLQGEDNAKDIAIIWPDFDIDAKKVDLYIAGLSNETVPIDHPIKKGKDGKPEKVLLRKTLRLSYSIGGSPEFRSQAALKFKARNWVLR
jgi:hypothetical protein